MQTLPDARRFALVKFANEVPVGFSCQWPLNHRSWCMLHMCGKLRPAIQGHIGMCGHKEAVQHVISQLSHDPQTAISSMHAENWFLEPYWSIL